MSPNLPGAATLAGIASRCWPWLLDTCERLAKPGFLVDHTADLARGSGALLLGLGCSRSDNVCALILALPSRPRVAARGCRQGPRCPAQRKWLLLSASLFDGAPRGL